MPITNTRVLSAAPPLARSRWFLLLAAFTLAVAVPSLAHADGDPEDVLLQLGDETLTREAFEQEFEIAARTTALQQGMEPTPEVLAEFEAFRPSFLDQLATQFVLVDHAEELGIAADAAEVDEVIAGIREAQGDGEAFEAYLETSGFSDEASLRNLIERSMSVQNVIDVLSADVEVSDAEIEAWYEANPEQVQTPEGPLPLDAIRDEIANILVQEQVDERVQEIVATAPLEVYVERL